MPAAGFQKCITPAAIVVLVPCSTHGVVELCRAPAGSPQFDGPNGHPPPPFATSIFPSLPSPVSPSPGPTIAPALSPTASPALLACRLPRAPQSRSPCPGRARLPPAFHLAAAAARRLAPSPCRNITHPCVHRDCRLPRRFNRSRLHKRRHSVPCRGRRLPGECAHGEARVGVA